MSPFQPVAVVTEDFAVGARGLGFDPGTVKSGTVSSTVRHRCDVFSEQRCVAQALNCGGGPHHLLDGRVDGASASEAVDSGWFRVGLNQLL